MKMAIGICMLIGSGLLSISFAYLLNHKDNPDEDMYQYFERSLFTPLFAGGEEEETMPSNYIGESGKSWIFDITEDNRTEVEADIFQINRTVIDFTLSEHPNASLSGGYKWHMALCNIKGVDDLKYMNEDAQGGFNYSVALNINYGKLIDYGMPENWCEETNGYGFVLFSSGGKNQLPKHIRLILLDNATIFKIYAGTGSVEIDGGATTTATAYGENENLCIVNNICHTAYAGGGADIWYSNATYNPVTNRCEDDWGITEILDATTATYVGITCAPDKSVTIHALVAADVDTWKSTDDGTTWVFATAEDDAETFDSSLAGTVGSDSVVHWCMIDNDDDLYYVNSDTMDSAVLLSSADSEHCDIAVDTSDDVYVIVSESGTDDIDIMSDADSWGSRNSWEDNAGTVTDSGGRGVSITICNNNTMYVASINTDDLWFCTGDTASWTTGDCKELDGSTSFSPDIACSLAGDPYILYMTSSTGDLVLTNRTDGSAFEVRTTLISTRRHPSIADSTSNRMDGVLHFLTTDASSNLFYNNFSIKLGPVTVYNLTITEPTTAVPFTNVVSGQTLEIDFNLTKWSDDVFDSEVTTGVTNINVTIDGTLTDINTTTTILNEQTIQIFYEDFEAPSWETTATTACDTSPDCNSIGDFNNCNNNDNDFLFCASSVSGDRHEGSYGGQTEDWDGGGVTNTAGIWYNFDASTACGGGQCENITVNIWAFENGLDFGENCWVTQQVAAGTPSAIITISYTDNEWLNYIANLTIPMSSTNVSIRIMCDMSDGADDVNWDEFNISGIGNLTITPQQFAYSTEKGIWEVNVTAPSKSDGTYDLFLNATYGGSTYNDTQTNAVTYGGEAADTCECPADGDWNVDCSDNCEISSECDMQGNNIYITGTGSFTTSARIFNFNDLRIQGTDATNRCHVRCDSACFDSQT